MKKVLTRLLASLSLLALPAAALAETTVDSTTMFRLFQDSRTGFATKDFAPVTQFLGIDTDKLGDGNLSLHLYGWGRLDLADKSYNNDQADVSLTHGYAQYHFNQANAQARLGRFFVHEGIVNEQIDGVSARTDLPLGFGISTFGGATVHTVHMPGENTDGKGDGIFGGRLNYRYKGMLELGVSGVYESTAPVLNATDGNFGSHRLIGGDVWLSPHRMVALMGHTSYNTETEGVAEHTYLLNVKPLHGLVLAGEFNEHRERNFFFSSVMFSSMVERLNEKSRSVGGSASYELNKMTEISGDFKHYTRDFGQADRFGGDIRFTMMDKMLRTGFAYHYLRSGPDFAAVPSTTPSGSFHEVRGFAMHDTKGYFSALDAIGYFFKQDINGRPSALELIGSLGYHITPAIALSGDISYGKNPQFVDELKGLIRLTCNMTYPGIGGKK